MSRFGKTIVSDVAKARFLIRWLFSGLLIAAQLAVNVRSGIAQTATPATEILVGIDGHYRVGHWTAVRYLGQDRATGIETRDGDGVRVTYGLRSDRNWGYAIPGSEAAPLVIQGADQPLLSTRFPTIGSPARGAAMIPRQLRWVVALGDALGIDKIGANELLNRDAMIAVSQPSSANRLPDSQLGYDGVDMLIIGGASAELLADLSELQQQAISDWIRSGGYLLLTLGQSAPAVATAAPWLIDLLPIDEVVTETVSPSALETFTSTKTPLDSFAAVRLPKDQGRVRVWGRTARRVSTPLAVEYNVGFGTIVAVAADLEDAMFAEWPERIALLTLLTDPLLVPESDQATSRNRVTAYDDLAGQLRASLDRFRTRRHFGFSVLALVVMVLLAMIGPLDYWVINRWWGRPLLGWITFPVVALGFSLALALQARPPAAAVASGNDGDAVIAAAVDPAALETNTLEIFDIDTIAGVGRVFAARYFYSHDASKVDIEVVPERSWQSVSARITELITAPLGSPGPAFGGIPIAIEDMRLPSYQIPFRSTGGTTSTRLVDLPIASRSSKGIFTRGDFAPELARQVSLQRRPGSELLEGELINPLPYDLLSGTLIFRNWAYRLPTRFAAGGRIESVAELSQKNFRWQLSHQQALEASETRTEAWDPTAVEGLGRIAEMVMFHRAAGGTRYTNLRNDPLATLDLSHVLAEDRCILVGRIEAPLTSSQTWVGRGAEKMLIDQRDGQSLSLIRIVLPVAERSP
jgi:hypothetical protein